MSVPSVSVIVPVYNGERFVAECLDSIARQRLDDIEIIIVDDGSIDSTAAICSDFVAAEPRARLVQKRNGGVSAARNSGLDIARGEYIAFIDADDWVTEDGLWHLLQEARSSGADIVIGDYLVVDGERQSRCIVPVVETAEQLLCAVLSGESHAAFWNKLVRRDLFVRARFPEGVAYLEDAVVLSRILADPSTRASFVDEVVYAYRLHPGAVTSSGGLKLLDQFESHLIIAESLRQGSHPRTIREALAHRIYQGTWFVLTMINRRHLGEAVERAKTHLRATRYPRKFASFGAKSMVMNTLLWLPQPLAVVGFRLLRKVLAWLSPARRQTRAQLDPASSGMP